MNRFVLSIGSNSGDREYQMSQIVTLLNDLFNNISVSNIYETPAINGKDAPYLNGVIIGHTSMNLDEAVKTLKELERNQGRTPELKIQGIVPIDIDVVIWNDEIVRMHDYEQDYFSQGYRQLNRNSNN